MYLYENITVVLFILEWVLFITPFSIKRNWIFETLTDNIMNLSFWKIREIDNLFMITVSQESKKKFKINLFCYLNSGIWLYLSYFNFYVYVTLV